MTGLRVTRHASLDEIPDWEEVAAGFYGTRGWLGVFTDLDATFIAVREGERLAGGAAFYVVPSPGALSTAAGIRCVPTELTRLLTDVSGTSSSPVPAAELYPYVFCGPPSGYSSRLLVRADASAELRASVTRALGEELVRFARDRDARSYAFVYLPPEETGELTSRVEGLAPAFGGTVCYLDLGGSFDEWAGRITPRMRRTVLKERRRFEEAGLRVEVRPFDEIGDAVELFLAHDREYGAAVDETHTRSVVERMRQRLQRQGFVLRAYHGGKPAAAVLSFVHDGVCHPRLAGFDYDGVEKRAALYFNTVFYGMIEACLERGVKTIDYSGAALDGKILRGCRAETLWFAAGVFDAPADLRAHLRHCGKARLDADVEVLLRHMEAPDVERALQLPLARRFLGD